MTQKFSATRRAAFLRALGETGNQTLSAARAKVSRSWVTLHRKDPEFDAAAQAALAAAKARLEAAGARRPPSGWGTLDGAQLVVRGTGGAGGGKRVQIARARLRQWDPATEDRFIATLQATCNVRASCKAAGMWPPSAYAHRKRWPSFERRWDAAVEESYMRIELGLLENGGNMFSARERPPEIDMPPMRVDEALQLLRLHKSAPRGIGVMPAKPRVPMSADELRGVIADWRALKERGETISPADRARDAAEWARRREGEREA